MRIYHVAEDCDRDLLKITTPYIGITNESTSSIVAIRNPDVNDIDCGTISVKKVERPRGEWIGPNYNNGIVEYSSYYDGKLTGVACSSNYDIRLMLKIAEKHFAVQRLISSLQPNEGLIVVTQDFEDFLLKFDSKTDDVKFIGAMHRPLGFHEESSPIIELLDTAPLVIRVQESIERIDGRRFFGFSSVDNLGMDIMFQTFALDSIDIPEGMSGEDIRNMTIGYSLAAFNVMCKENGESPEKLIARANREYFSKHPEVDVDMYDGIIKRNIPEGFTIDTDRIDAWRKEGELHLPMKDELMAKNSLEEYNKGYYFCLIEYGIPHSYSLVKIKEGEEDKIEVLNLADSSASEIKNTLPSYGYLNASTFVTKNVDDSDAFYHLCAYACIQGKEPIKLFERDTDKDPAYSAVSTAYASMILGGIENPDKEIIDAAKQLSESMGESKFEWHNVLGGVQSYKFSVGLKPDPNIEQTARMRLEEISTKKEEEELSKEI